MSRGTPTDGDSRFPTLPRPGRPARSRGLAVLTAALVAVLVSLSVILALNGGALPFGHQSPSRGNPVLIYVDGINRSLTYQGNMPPYFGPEQNDSCAFCPIGAQEGGAIRIPLATWSPPANLSFWVFTNVSGPFLVQEPSCSPTPCTFPWVKVWSFRTYVPADALSSLTLFATFQLPSSPTGYLNIINLTASFCPSTLCAPPPTP